MTTGRSRQLRLSATEAEKLLWTKLRNRQLDGWKFCRQMEIGSYIADFVCREKMLIVEIDGGQHAENERDLLRTIQLEQLGYRVVRFWNHDVLGNIEGVLVALQSALTCPSPKPSPRKPGEGVKGDVEKDETPC